MKHFFFFFTLVAVRGVNDYEVEEQKDQMEEKYKLLFLVKFSNPLFILFRQ